MSSGGIFVHVRRNLMRGLLLLLPLLITIWLLGLLFAVIDGNVTPMVKGLLEWAGMPGLERLSARLGVSVIGILLTIMFIYLCGVLVGNIGGRRAVATFESWIMRIPLVKGIYGSARQLLDAFSETGRRHFSKVVMIEYPRKGLYTIGFVTRESRHDITGDGQRGAVPVFLPTTPNPTSGWMVLVPEDTMVVLDMSIEDGLKLVVSGGIVSPPDLGRLVKPAES